jgi:hypothetical protein
MERVWEWGFIVKPLPAPQLPGDTPAQRLDRAFRTVLTVPKEALVKEEQKDKRQREKKRRKKSA